MRRKKPTLFLSLGGFLLFLGVGLWLLTPESVQAQCGSQASSCKSCHEVQAAMPVNNDDTGWHESHAFGDFCAFCHAGNVQATDKETAHTGMVAPLSDVEAACQQCHTSDLMDRAQVYATILNVRLGGEGPTSNQADSTSEPAGVIGTPIPEQPVAAQPAARSALNAPAIAEMVVDDPNAVDYVQRYNEIVLGERPVNWGNVTLIGLIGLIGLGGGGFAIMNELRLMRRSGDMRKVEGDYPAEVLEMLPAIARLKPPTRRTLKNILNNSGKSDKVLGLIDTLISEEDTAEKKQ